VVFIAHCFNYLTSVCQGRVFVDFHVSFKKRLVGLSGKLHQCLGIIVYLVLLWNQRI